MAISAVDKTCGRYISLAERRAWLLLLGFWLVAALLLWPISQLELHTDMAELLPDGHPAVQALRRVVPRQISSSNLVIIVESPDPQANQRFAEALRPRLQSLVGTLFSEVQFKPESEVPEFAHKWRWLYASQADLRSAETLLERLVARRSSPLVVDLEGDPEVELRALRERMRTELNRQIPPQGSGSISSSAPYFQFKSPTSATHHLGIMLWRQGDGLATSGDEQTLRLVEQLVADAQPSRFHPQLRIEYSGAIAMALAEAQAVRADLTLATGVCVTLVLLAIYLYFRRFAVLLVVGAPALLGLLFALALARIFLHSLNVNSAFLISIILGNGINSPIVLLARYGEERQSGQPVGPALRTALAGTLTGTLGAMAAASIAYGSLLATTLRGLSQFGLVGGAGMLMVWLFTFLLVPPLVIVGERLRPGLLSPAPNLWRRPLRWLGQLGQRAPLAVACSSLLLAAVAAVPAVRYARDPLEYNFDNLRTDDPSAARLWGIMYDLGLGNVGAGHIARDGVILVDSPSQAEPVADALWQQDQALGERRVLDEVRTLRRILPSEQTEKLAILGRIRAELDRHRERVDADEWAELEAWRPPDYLRPLAVPDLPRRLRENFTEVDGTIGRLIGIDADPHRFVENDGRDLIRLSRSLQVTALGKTWVAASASTVFAGMLEIIIRDAPRVGLLALFGVSALLFALFGRRGAPLVLLSLGVGLLWLVGLLGGLGWKLNFLNFAALPITLGVGADYAANLWARVRREGTERIADIVADTGSAVVLCSVTTIIGYSSLLLSRSRALQSFGRLADLGEVTCLVAALLVLPAVALLIQRQRRASGS